MKCLLLAALFAVVGCGPTRHPEVIPASLAKRTDAMAREALDALARRDGHKLAELGASEAEVNAALARSPQLALPLDCRFATDHPIGTKYLRAYLVRLTAGGDVPIAVWFKDPTRVKLESFQFPGDGTSIESRRPPG